MRQAFGAFKARPIVAAKRGGALAAFLFLQSCATIFGSGKAELVASQAIELETARAEHDELQSEVEKLKTENERLAGELSDLTRKTARVAVIEPVAEIPAPPRAAEPAFSEAGVSDKSPSTAPTSPVVAAPNVDATLPAAPVPVDDQPRLVQPRFASTEEIFENEAANQEIKMTSVLWGVHLASYRRVEEASAGWNKLQRDNPDELGLLEPRIERVSIEGKGAYLRLVGGGFSSREKAKALCDTLAVKGVFCRIANFGGERLSMLDVNDLR